jgi:pectin methylesterase-like acyl-CoA thioesterase
MTPLADLGRPWRAHASVTYLNCEMGSHISPTGWNNWGQKTNEATARYSEYHSTGPGGASDKRYPWARQLADDQAKAITVESVLGGRDHWDPKVIAASLAQSPPTAAVSLPNESR